MTGTLTFSSDLARAMAETPSGPDYAARMMKRLGELKAPKFLTPCDECFVHHTPSLHNTDRDFYSDEKDDYRGA
jgi:hypothetical protein